MEKRWYSRVRLQSPGVKRLIWRPALLRERALVELDFLIRVPVVVA